jgi:hypothetical protein
MAYKARTASQIVNDGGLPEDDPTFTETVRHKSPGYYGATCPGCGLGIDTDGDGNCALCRPDYQKPDKVPTKGEYI